MAWNSDSIAGTFSCTHFRLNRCGTSKIGTRYSFPDPVHPIPDANGGQTLGSPAD